ncbi:MAG: helicase domain protein [Anaerocolumna sp.]|nr:helicase domain protein [Anaerocolumna sp.]
MYIDFLNNKNVVMKNSGFEIDRDLLNKNLYDFQKDIVKWSLIKGRSAIFADCGLGKTLMQLEWSYKVSKYTNGKVLILAPLAVTEQTKREGIKFGIDVNICEMQEDVKIGINITNYEKLDRFDTNEFNGIVLDESSILKSFTGKVRTLIISKFKNTPYKLCCTATPAPNDYMELGNHAEFLGVMNRNEMLSMYFVHDGGETSKWRLKGHAENVFWEWISSWSVLITNPIDLGYKIDGYYLPELKVNEIIVDGEKAIEESLTLTQRRNARKESLSDRCRAAAEFVNNSDEQWLVWCNLNDESKLLHELINKSVEVKGSDKPKHKTTSSVEFAEGNIKCLVSKPLIFGMGLNFQKCHNMIFVGLSDSYEQYYQAVRRCWRFGQEHEVNIYIIISSKEGCVKANINRKENDANRMQKSMIEFTKNIKKNDVKATCRLSTPYNANIDMLLPKWEEFMA